MNRKKSLLEEKIRLLNEKLAVLDKLLEEKE